MGNCREETSDAITNDNIEYIISWMIASRLSRARLAMRLILVGNACERLNEIKMVERRELER